MPARKSRNGRRISHKTVYPPDWEHPLELTLCSKDMNTEYKPDKERRLEETRHKRVYAYCYFDYYLQRWKPLLTKLDYERINRTDYFSGYVPETIYIPSLIWLEYWEFKLGV